MFWCSLDMVLDPLVARIFRTAIIVVLVTNLAQIMLCKMDLVGLSL